MKTYILSAVLNFASLCTSSDTFSWPTPADLPKASLPAYVTEETPEEEPVQAWPFSTDLDQQVTIKVFDSRGVLMLQKHVGMNELLQHSHLQHLLPEGSIFVYFNQHTAYYFLDSTSR